MRRRKTATVAKIAPRAREDDDDDDIAPPKSEKQRSKTPAEPDSGASDEEDRPLEAASDDDERDASESDGAAAHGNASGDDNDPRQADSDESDASARPSRARDKASRIAPRGRKPRAPQDDAAAPSDSDEELADESEEEESAAAAPDIKPRTSTLADAQLRAVPDAQYNLENVVRGGVEEIIVIAPGSRRTSQIMSLSEYTEAISIRAEQIGTDGISGAMIDEADVARIPAFATGTCTARDIAIAEMKARRCPLRVTRSVGRAIDPETGVPKNYVEIWSPNEMMHPPFQ
ncbi:MAG: hypothetical protein M0R66_07235 [Candidatus Omnitrophica bacterium]|nr:hypothetical protein [Candidatus Omnitrophota bacterium]